MVAREDKDWERKKCDKGYRLFRQPLLWFYPLFYEPRIWTFTHLTSSVMQEHQERFYEY